MKKPKFYCTQFIECNSNIKKYQPADCKEQCSACMDIIIDHHFNKKPKLETMEITTKQAVDKLTAELKKDPSLFIAWQSNIAMAVYDLYVQKYGGYFAERPTLPEAHQLCNDGAIRFLNLLCEDRPNDTIKTGAELIAEERAEHTNKHDWTPEHDDNHTYGELACAAVACLMLDEDVRASVYEHGAAQVWPWRSDDPYYLNICQKDRIGQLKISGAFIAAEIDRLQRLELDK